MRLARERLNHSFIQPPKSRDGLHSFQFSQVQATSKANRTPEKMCCGGDAVDEDKFVLCCALCCTNCAVYPSCDACGFSGKVKRETAAAKIREARFAPSVVESDRFRSCELRLGFGGVGDFDYFTTASLLGAVPCTSSVLLSQQQPSSLTACSPPFPPPLPHLINSMKKFGVLCCNAECCFKPGAPCLCPFGCIGLTCQNDGCSLVNGQVRVTLYLVVKEEMRSLQELMRFLNARFSRSHDFPPQPTNKHGN